MNILCHRSFRLYDGLQIADNVDFSKVWQPITTPWWYRGIIIPCRSQLEAKHQYEK